MQPIFLSEKCEHRRDVKSFLNTLSGPPYLPSISRRLSITLSPRTLIVLFVIEINTFGAGTPKAYYALSLLVISNLDLIIFSFDRHRVDFLRERVHLQINLCVLTS